MKYHSTYGIHDMRTSCKPWRVCPARSEGVGISTSSKIPRTGSRLIRGKAESNPADRPMRAPRRSFLHSESQFRGISAAGAFFWGMEALGINLHIIPWAPKIQRSPARPVKRGVLH